MMSPMLEAFSLCWSTGKKEIVSVDKFSVSEGEIVAIVGPNGAGKSSLLNLLALLQKPSSGKIIMSGKDAYENLLASRRQMAFIFQDPLLLRGTVFSNVALGLTLRGIKKAAITTETRAWLEKLGLAELAGRNVKNLSGGEAQRVNIARALITRPKILFMDEPFASLDIPTKAELLADLSSLLRSTGTSAVLVTHDMSDLPGLADRVCVMSSGRLIQYGPPQEVLCRPASKEVARIVGIENIFSCTVNPSAGTILLGGKLELNISSLPGMPLSQLPGEHTAYFRADSIFPAGATGDAANFVRGTVQKIIPYGNTFKIIVDFYGLSVTASVNHTMILSGNIKAGQEATFYLPPELIHVS